MIQSDVWVVESWQDMEFLAKHFRLRMDARQAQYDIYPWGARIRGHELGWEQEFRNATKVSALRKSCIVNEFYS